MPSLARMADAPPRAYEVVLGPGDVIVWYPGYAHETYTLDADSVALSVEFRLPRLQNI